MRASGNYIVALYMLIDSISNLYAAIIKKEELAPV